MEEGWGGEGVAHVFQRCYCVWIVFVTPLVLVLSGVVIFFKNQFSGGSVEEPVYGSGRISVGTFVVQRAGWV